MNIQKAMKLIATNNRTKDIYDMYAEVQRGELSMETLQEVIERELELIDSEQ